ncbi:hypothetical protein ACHAXT_008668 [Thalassiosira profunda]
MAATATETNVAAERQLRIASLLPSTTDICISLGLAHQVVGVTHECDYGATHPLYQTADPLIVGGNCNNGEGTKPRTLTVSHIDPQLQTQAEIDRAVKTSVHSGISLYNLNDTALTDAQPSIVLTQSLCDVCAVAKDEVDGEVACNFAPGQCKVLSLEPESLEEVIGTFKTVADACGVKQRGIDLARKMVRSAIDAGHWIPDMLAQSGCASALPHSKNTRKSVQLSWEQIYESDPDVVIVGCCGFDLKRNKADAKTAVERLRPLRAFREGRIYAADGNLYFARPGPGLREGMAILARCAYDGEEVVVNALEDLNFMPQEGKGWSKIVFDQSPPPPVPDVEDIESYCKVHDEACRKKQDTYIDPKTGYSVFTEVAHLRRGKCCGSGCRHCPYNHVNVKDKASKIQQPAFLCEGLNAGEDSLCTSLSSIPPRSHVKVLFFSGGKDSFLAVRRLVKQRQESCGGPFSLVLLTTFDAGSRIVTHQEISIDAVVRQAEHLRLPLLGIPLHRSSGEKYLDRIEKGLDAIRQRVPDVSLTLVFGDLHLDHIREWRDKEMGDHALGYPLWQVPYEELYQDLEASGVRVVVSAVTTGDGVVKVGDVFSRDLMKDAAAAGMDSFGEKGEFHSIAEVWTVSREQALGL